MASQMLRFSSLTSHEIVLLLANEFGALTFYYSTHACVKQGIVRYSVFD